MDIKAIHPNVDIKYFRLFIQKVGFLDVLVFLIGLSSAYYLSFIGQVYLAELLLPLTVPLVWKSRQFLLLAKEVKWLTLFGGFWLLSQVVTDITQSTPIADSLRGWALIGVFLLDTLALYLLIVPNHRRILISLSGFALGGVVQPILQPDNYFIIDAWKFGFGQPLTLLVIIVGCMWAGRNLYRHAIWAVVIGCIGTLSLYKDFRSLGGVTLLTAFAVFMSSILFNYTRSKRLKMWNLAVIGLLTLLITWGILSGYRFAAQNGWLRDTSRVKSQIQSTSAIELIIRGRSELIPAFYAIGDSPFIGHGSWARDPKYRNYLYDLIRLGYVDPSESGRINYLVISSDTIPVHSHILQAWVWSGILGALFWVIVLIIIFRTIIKTIISPNRLFPLVIFTSILSIWNLLFSPFGSIMRLQWAYFLVIWLCTLIPGIYPASSRRT